MQGGAGRFRPSQQPVSPPAFPQVKRARHRLPEPIEEASPDGGSLRLRSAGPINRVGIFRRTLLRSVKALVAPSLCRAQGTSRPGQGARRLTERPQRQPSDPAPYATASAARPMTRRGGPSSSGRRRRWACGWSPSLTCSVTPACRQSGRRRRCQACRRATPAPPGRRAAAPSGSGSRIGSRSAG